MGGGGVDVGEGFPETRGAETGDRLGRWQLERRWGLEEVMERERDCVLGKI